MGDILPAEILSEIMVLATGHTIAPIRLLPSIVATFGLPQHHAPWNFTAVCRRWRETAISTGEIWSSLTIMSLESIETDRDSIQSFIAFIDMIVRRAIPKNLSFCLSPFDLNKENRRKHRLYREIFELFMSHSTDWKRATFTVTDTTFPGMARLRGQLPNLQHLSVDCCRLSRAFGKAKFDMFDDVPSLKSFTAISTDIEEFNLPWSQLRKASFEKNSLTAVDLLRCMPQLEAIKISDGSSGEPNDTSHLVHQLLRRLEFGDLYGSHDLLGYLTLPALESLMLYSVERFDFRTSLPGLISRSSCSIRELSFHVPRSPKVEPSEWIAFFELVPALESLSISGSIGDDEFFQLLVLPPAEDQSPRLLPQLQDLEVEVSAVGSGFADFIESRVHAHKLRIKVLPASYSRRISLSNGISERLLSVTDNCENIKLKLPGLGT